MEYQDQLIQALMNTGGMPQMNYAPTSSGALGEYVTGTNQITVQPGLQGYFQQAVPRHEQTHALQDRTTGLDYMTPVEQSIQQRLNTPQQQRNPRYSNEQFAQFIEGRPNTTLNPLTFMILRMLSNQVFGQAMRGE